MLAYSVQSNPSQYELRLYDIAQNQIVARRSHQDILHMAPGIYFPHETITEYAMSPDLQTIVFDHPTHPFRFVYHNVFDGDGKPVIFTKGHAAIQSTPPIFSKSPLRIFFHGYITWQFTQIDHFVAEERENRWIVSPPLNLSSTMWRPISYLFDISDDGKSVLAARNNEIGLLHETDSGWNRWESINRRYTTGDRAQLSGDGTVLAISSQRHQDRWVGRPIFDILIYFKQQDGTWIYQQGNDLLWAEANFLLSKDGSHLYWTSLIPIPTPTATPTAEPGTGIRYSEWLLHP